MAKSGTVRSTQSPKLSDLPSFIPSTHAEKDQSPLQQVLSMPPLQTASSQNTTSRPFNPDSPAFTPSVNLNSLQASPQLHNPYLPPPPIPQNQDLSLNSNIPKFNPYAANDNSYNVNASQNFMFQPPAPQQFQPQTSFPLQYHLYAPVPPPHLQIPLTGNKENSQSLFIPGKLRETLTQKNEDTLRVLPNPNLPEFVDVYYDLFPLDKTLEKKADNYGFTNSLYKAFSNTDGHVYALRRIENVQLSEDKSVSTINRWKSVQNANVANVIDAFTTRAFGDNSLIIVYDYYPTAKTLDELHCNPAFGDPQPVKGSIWIYLVQIALALSSIHSNNLAARSLSLQKIILTSQNRIRLSDVGVSDILNYQSNLSKEELAKLKQDDITQLGKIILLLYLKDTKVRFRTLPSIADLDIIDFKDLQLKSAIKYLIDESKERSINEFRSLFSSKFFEQFDRIQTNTDYYEAQLTRELENSRLVRLLSKINFIIDRPELSKNLSPTGDKYPIQLFHHYVFHQVDENGAPVLDLSHVLRCLNKLDVGVDEKILLVSADEQSCLIMSYRELKDLVARTFTELLKERK